ncbi:MAG: Na/Pi cotransporter family protein [Sphaerochaetaceae bacterium]
MLVFVTILSVAGSLGLFLYGMKLLSEGLQKTAGDKLKNILKMMTKNRFVAVLTGILITILVQSSSATTVMVVSFVNAGLMSLVESIGVIFGANIGTTFTGWIVAILGFKMDISLLALASIGISAPMLFSKKGKTREKADVFLGFGILFLGLHFMQTSIPDLSGNMEVLSWLSKFNNDNLFNILLFVLIGTGITVIVQSSAATMVMVLTMAYNGYLGVNAAAALILGSNIGTTITAFLASIGTSTAAKRTAMAHIMFNVIGTLVTIIFFRPMMYVCNVLTPGNIYTMTGKGLNQSLPTFLAMFHTLFNLFNTLIFFPFVKPYAKLIEKMVPDTAEYDEGTYHFRYIGTTLIDSPEVYMLVIRDEIKKMADLACNMFSRYRNVFNTNDVDMDNEVAMMKKQEEYADQMQEQLSDFCVHCIQDSQTPTNASSLNCLIRVMDELESVTDSCYNLIILSQRQFHQGWKFEEETARELQGFEELVQAFLNYVRDRMDRTLTKAEMQKANEFEFQINEWRNRLSQTVQEKLSDGKADVKQELLVLEKIRHLEHIGDYCTNIAEAYHQAVKHTPVLQRRSAG